MGKMVLELTLVEALIVKHALRDWPNKNEKEFKDFLRDYESRAWTTIRRSRRMQFTVPKQIGMEE